VLVDTLEARHDHHVAGVEVRAQALVVDLADARLGVCIVREDAHLRAV
jgi:hypothetical protein